MASASAHSMYANYNKGDQHAVRLGNWQEERALQELTGSHRMPKDQMDISVRTMGKLDGPRELSTTYRKAYLDPNDVPSHANQHSEEGVRARNQLRQLEMMVEAEFDQVEHQRQAQTLERCLETSNRTDFGAAPLEKYLEARTFRTKGGKKPEPAVEKLPDMHYTEGTSVTVYSETLKEEQRTGKQVFPKSYVVNHTYPFGKSTSFSADIRDPLAFHAESHETLTNGGV